MAPSVWLFVKTCLSECLGFLNFQRLLYNDNIIIITLLQKENIWATTWQNQESDWGPAKTQISLGICPVWSVFAVCSMGS